VVEAYGIKHDFSGEESVRIANRLAYFSKERKVFADPEELRDQVLKISMQNYQENPVEFLANHIDMPRVWEAIATGEVRENYHKAATVAENIGKYAEELIHFGYSASYVGAVAENYMRSNGYQLEDFACGRLNSSILNSTGMGVVYKSELLGGIRLVGLEGKFVKKCPYPDCDREINKVIHRGYKCKCGRVYKAVC
jgi:hypothetical protein